MTRKEREKQSPVWDISQERAFMENLVIQRVNFLIVFFSLVVAGSINSQNNKILQFSILVAGIVITGVLAMTVIRSQQKLDIILKDIFMDKNHPATIANTKAKGFSVRKLIGYFLPFVCVFFLVIMSIFSFYGHISSN